MWFNIAMKGDRLSFASAESDKNYSLTLSRWKSLCHRWSRFQRQERAWERGWGVFLFRVRHNVSY